jgi:hypothetical protein
MRFQKGVPRNPLAGRRKGAQNKRTLLLEDVLQDKRGELISKLITMALDGNVEALKLWFNYEYPRAAPLTYVQLELPKISCVADVQAAAVLIVEQMASVKIAVEDAHLALGCLEKASGQFIHEFEQRIAELQKAGTV